MNHLIRIAALLIALGLFAYAPVHALDEGDWKGGWTSWKKAEKGDWAEYSSSSGIKIRYEVLDAKGDNVNYTHTSYDVNGKEAMKKEKTEAWNKIKLIIKLPYKTVEVKWSEETLTLSGTEIKCDVASYKQGEIPTVAYYSKDVPCGGFVKAIVDNKDNWWLSAYHTSKVDVKVEPKPEAAKTKMPRFYAEPGNTTIIKISSTDKPATYQLREVLKVEETSAKYKVVACSEDGTPVAGAKSVEVEQKIEDWDKLYAKPSEQGVTLKVGAGEFICDVFKTSSDGKEISEWVCEGALIKKVVKTASNETVLEAVKITMK